MYRRYKFAALIASIVLVIIAVTTMGVSYAIWTNPDGTIGGEGATSVSPSVTPDTSYIWAKYFEFNEITVGSESADEGESESGTGASSSVHYAEITRFYSDGAQSAGLNLSDVHIPDVFWEYTDGANVKHRIDSYAEYEAIKKSYSVTTYTTYRICNSIFADSTLKNLPIRIYIPERACEIQAMAFAGLPNLEAVYFYTVNTLEIGNYAFSGCPKLSSLVFVKSGRIKANRTAFIDTAVDSINYNADGTISPKA